jgi:hypothetical protein
VVRNGYHQSREVLTSAGAVEVTVPRVNDRRTDPGTGERMRFCSARTARHGRGHITLHLPEGWHRAHEWNSLFEAACGPPATAA